MPYTVGMDQRLAIYAIASGLAICYCIISLTTRLRRIRKAKQWGCLPAYTRPYRWPWALDILYSLIQADKEQRVPEWLLDSFKEAGQRPTWLQNDIGTMNYVTCDPKNIQAILATQFHDFETGKTRRLTFYPLLGNGIFTTDGKEWEHSRSMLRPQFSRQQVSDLQLEETHVKNALEHLLQTQPHNQQDWTAFVDIVPLFFRLTVDSATEFLFGQSINSQIAALPNRRAAQVSLAKGGLDWTSFGPAFDAATADLATRGRLHRFFWLYNPKSFKNHCQDVHRFADYYVNLALNTPPPSTREGEKGRAESQTTKYVFLQELVQQTRDPVEIRSQLLNILLAGRDTTAGLLGWTFHLLARHPHVFNTLRQTVVNTFGSGDDLGLISFEALKQCTYLQHTLNEVLRLFPNVPNNFRVAVRDTTLPRGGGQDGTSPVFVKKGQQVSYSVHVMHHRQDIWGADVEEFKPERWIHRKPSWEFLPFNGGPRICLGQQFALTEAGYVIVRLLQTFDGLEMMESDASPRHQYSLTTAPARLSVRFHKAVGPTNLAVPNLTTVPPNLKDNMDDQGGERGL